jgi:hypothetical protein
LFLVFVVPSAVPVRSFVAVNKPTDGKHFLRALGKVYAQAQAQSHTLHV